MPTLKGDPQGGFSFQGVVRFEGLERFGTDLTNATLVFRFDDGKAMRMNLPHSDLAALQVAIAGWIGESPIAAPDKRTKH